MIKYIQFRGYLEKFMYAKFFNYSHIANRKQSCGYRTYYIKQPGWYKQLLSGKRIYDARTGLDDMFLVEVQICRIGVTTTH